MSEYIVGLLNPTMVRKAAVCIGIEAENNSRGWLVNLAQV